MDKKNNNIDDNGNIDYNKIINDPAPHESQNTITKNDMLSKDERQKLRYIKITSKFNKDYYYSELTLGTEKPKDNKNFSFEYVSRFEALIGMYGAKYGKAEVLRFLDEYLRKLRYNRRENAIKNLELEIIRPNKELEAKLRKN